MICFVSSILILHVINCCVICCSQVDVENPDLAKFPKFAEAPWMECTLQEGEMLYMPPRFWHHVRSLSTSFSVSFWW